MENILFSIWFTVELNVLNNFFLDCVSNSRFIFCLENTCYWSSAVSLIFYVVTGKWGLNALLSVHGPILTNNCLQRGEYPMEDNSHPHVEEASACGNRRSFVKITSPVSLPKRPDFPVSILPFDSGRKYNSSPQRGHGNSANVDWSVVCFPDSGDI